MKTLNRSLLIALLSISIVVIAIGSTDDRPEIPQWKEITSATDLSDFKLNCQYQAVFEYVPGGTRALFLNFVAVGESGYPGVTSVASADASGGQNFRVENVQKNTVKFGNSSFSARIFERCYHKLPGSLSE